MLRAPALFVILLACGASLVGTASPASAATPCWKQVVDDWSQDGHVDGRYSPACIEKALANVPEDIRAYSDFEEQAKAARLANSRFPQSAGGAAPGDETQMLQEREPNTNSKDETPIQSVLGTHGNNADSIPLPLLILLGLAGALITAGAAGFGARKLRARRTAAR